MGGNNNSLDLTVLDELREILEDGLDELIAEYLHEAPSELLQLRDAVERDDILNIVSIAHSLKGSSGNLGISGLYNLCATLEQEAKSGSHVDFQASLAEIKSEFARARADIAHYLVG